MTPTSPSLRLGERMRWLPGALAAWVAGAVLMAVLSVPIAQAAGLSGAVVLQALAGMVVWGAVARRSVAAPGDALQLIGIGLAVGMGLAVAAGVLVDLVLPGWPGWLLPALIAAVAWFRPGSTLPSGGAWTWRRQSAIAGAVGVAVGLGGVVLNIARYPLAWTGEWDRYHLDMQFFEALSTSIARYGPAESIFMAGAEIRYHWLGYGWAGQLAESFGTAPFVTLTRVLPATALVAVMALAASWAAARSGGWRVPIVAVLLIATGGYLGALNGAILNFDSPSESMAAAWLMALVIVSLLALEQRNGRVGWLLLVAALAAFVTGGKISASAVGVAALGLVAVVITVRRDPRWRWAWALLAAAVGGALLTFLLLIAGTATGGTLQVLSVAARAAYVQGLILDKGVIGVAAGTLALILAMAARWLGVVWLVGDRSSRWRDDTVLAVGLIIASIIPVLLLSEGVSETWFGLAASVPLSVLSAVGLGAAWQRIQTPAALLLSVVAVVPVLAAVTFLWAQGESTTASARFWGPPVGYLLAIGAGMVVALVARGPVARRVVWVGSTLTILVLAAMLSRLIPIAAGAMPQVPYLTGPVGNVGTDLLALEETGRRPLAPAGLDLASLPPITAAWSSTYADAADALYGLTEPSDIVVTNETTSFLVPALSRRLTYMTGAPYQWQYGSASSVGGIPERAETSRAFVDDVSPEAFAELCRAGVTWLWASHDLTDRRDWQPYATVEFSNDEVSLARLDRSRCP